MELRPKINPSKINYLSFEGGGGRGIVYLGAVRALEEIFRVQTLDVIPPTVSPPAGVVDGGFLKEKEISGHRKLIYTNEPLASRRIRGISGSSAGAITAFSLAIGMSSFDIEEEMNDSVNLPLGLGTEKWKNSKGSVYEAFFEEPDTSGFRAVDPTPRKGEYAVNEALLHGILRVVNAPQVPPIGPLTPVALGQAAVRAALAGGAGAATAEDSIVSQRISGTEAVPGQPVRFIKYLHSLIYNRGIFSGLQVDSYFERLMEKYLLNRQRSYYPDRTGMQESLSKRAADITFRDLFNLTGVDLLINGTNVSAHQGKYFSVGHTPDFPVISAVSLSMSMPMLFKPVLVKTNVDNDRGTDDYIRGYEGLYLDGGMTQNFPLHAFDHLGRFKHRGGVTPMPSPLLFKGEDVSDSIEVSIPRGDAAPTVTFCDCLVGLNLGIDPPYDYSRKEPEDFDPTGAGVLGKFMEDLVDTIVHPGGAGQVRTYEEDLATIWLNTYRPDSDHPGDALSTYDFSTPSICRSRRDEHKARLIEDLVRLAEETVLKSFQG